MDHLSETLLQLVSVLMFFRNASPDTKTGSHHGKHCGSLQDTYCPSREVSSSCLLAPASDTQGCVTFFA
ncbi:unnamed protein product [Ixodes pacificus]